jgi:hypothetical protein
LPQSWPNRGQTGVAERPQPAAIAALRGTSIANGALNAQSGDGAFATVRAVRHEVCVMKKFLLASAGILAMSVIAASAADLPRQRMPAKAEPVYVPPVWSWTGFYVGINGGGGFGRSDFAAPFPSGSFNTSGGLVGGTLGYNYQMDNVVLGIEGDIDWSNIRGSAPRADAWVIPSAISCPT